MDFVDIFIFVFFLANMGVFFAKLNNVLSNMKFMDSKGIIMTFILSLFSWLIVLTAVMAQVGSVILALTSSMYLRINSFILVVNVMLTIAEVFLMYGQISQRAIVTRERRPSIRKP